MGCSQSSTIEDEKYQKNNGKGEEKNDEISNDKMSKENSEEKEKKSLGVSSDARKINLHKQNYEGVVLMKGVEESIPEDLNEDDIYQLVANALYDKLVDDKDKAEGKITKKQAKAIASILYNKIKKVEGKKDSKKNDLINIDNYPELKGMKIKIGVGKLTREIIKDMMFHDKKVDECQIDLTYVNLTRENSDVKALTIEFE